MIQRPPIPKYIQRNILIKGRRRCCLCFWLSGLDKVTKGQIAHLDKDRTNNAENNLVFLCLDHHDEFDSSTSQSKGLEVDEVRHWRDKLYHYFEHLEEKLFVTSQSPNILETENTQKPVDEVLFKKDRQVTSSRTRFELKPSRKTVAKGDSLSLECMISGLGDKKAPTLGGFTLVLLWNINQLKFEKMTFGNNLGGESNSIRHSHLLEPGQFNPADPDFAAVVFSEHTKLPAEELTRIQAHSPVIVTFVFRSLTNGPIRFNAGFPYGQNSLLDANRIPSLESSVSALFLNQE